MIGLLANTSGIGDSLAIPAHPKGTCGLAFDPHGQQVMCPFKDGKPQAPCAWNPKDNYDPSWDYRTMPQCGQTVTPPNTVVKDGNGNYVWMSGQPVVDGQAAPPISYQVIADYIQDQQPEPSTPIGEPVPQPAPSPTPQPAPSPTPQPAPSPTPQPTPSPTPQPTFIVNVAAPVPTVIDNTQRGQGYPEAPFTTKAASALAAPVAPAAPAAPAPVADSGGAALVWIFVIWGLLSAVGGKSRG